MAFKPIKIEGMFIKRSKTGKSLQVTIKDIDATLIDMRNKLTKRPTWKKTGYSDKEREFLITNNGSIGEIWEDEETPKAPEPEMEDF